MAETKIETANMLNEWLGTIVEDQQQADERIPRLLKVPAAVRFLSMEPLLGPVDIRRWIEPDCPACHTGACEHGPVACPPKIHWVIVGGESGPHARPMLVEWAESLRDQCREAGVAFFMKQLGCHPRRLTGTGAAEVLTLRDKKGGDMDEWPADLRVREVPLDGREWNDSLRS